MRGRPLLVSDKQLLAVVRIEKQTVAEILKVLGLPYANHYTITRRLRSLVDKGQIASERSPLSATNRQPVARFFLLQEERGCYGCGHTSCCREEYCCTHEDFFPHNYIVTVTERR